MDIVVLLFIVLFALAVVIIAIVIINMRKRRRETQKEQRRKAEQEAKQRAEQKKRQQLEEKRRKADEERKRLENEAQQKAKEEEQKRLAAELQKAEGERHKAEEERKRLEEEARCREEETRRKAEEDARQRAKEDKKRRQIPPVHRPPRRPPISQEPPEKRPPQETKQRRPKPEIVCWKRERQWMVGVEVPEELLGNSGLVVLQNASPLTQDEYREGCWCLEQAFGEMVVHWNEDEDTKESKVSLSEENYLLFKLTGRNQNQGRRVKSPSSGSYLVVVPEAWERDEALSGAPPAPEPVSLAGYKVHFLSLEKDGDRKIAFRTPAGESFVIESKAARIELVGTRLNDANEDMGPLFGERPPQIRALDEQAWKDVKTIVVGEEGSGKGRWRTAFSPRLWQIEQDLPSEFAARKGGWYFLRFYDVNNDLVESLDFRFLGGLKDIKVHQPSPLPSKAGHATVSIELFHEPDCRIKPADGLEGSVQIEHEDDKTILTIPPDQTSDETRWLVGPQDEPQVEVTILVERLWWAVGEDDNSLSEWVDQPFTLRRDDFAATSVKALWLQLPRRRWVDVVSVGFERSKARQFSVKVTEKMLTIPLREFGDSTEVGDREQEHFLKVWIEQADGLVEGVIAIIPAKRALLNPSMISAPRLATVLTSLRKVTSGPLLVLIKEARKTYPIAHAARRAGSVEFAKNALCVIALALELRGEEQSRILSLKKHWRIKAGIARDEFPEIMNRVRKRYKDVDASGARRAGNMYDKRYAE